MTEIRADVQTNKFSYRIEPGPEGGFVGKPSEPGLPLIQGATREEVQQKIQAAVTEMVSSRFPAFLKLGGINVKVNRNINITRRTLSASPDNDLGSALSSENTSAVSATPILPERSSATMLWVIVGFVLVAALLYFTYLHK